MGFSQSTCLPASAARMVYSQCIEFGQADVDGFNGGVVADLVVGLVGVDGALREVILRCVLRAFFRGMACDDAR